MRLGGGWVVGVLWLWVSACSSAPPAASTPLPGAPPPGACVPRTDCGNAQCGTVEDGCGGALACGTCAEGSVCESSPQGNVCTALFEEGKAGEPLFLGRHARMANGDVRFGFPGSGLALRFEGTRVAVELHDRSGRSFQNHLRVRIDDRPPFTLKLDRDQDWYELASDLPPGVHEVRITKLTEGFVGAIDLRAVDVGGGKLLAARARARRLLFVGDSTTAAFGVLGKGPTCPYAPAEQDVEAGYATLTAEALGAEPLLVARSGVGFFQNYDGTRTDVAMDLLDAALPFDEARWELTQDRPGAVVLFLGDNDFAHAVPHEADFVPAVTKMLTRLRTVFPKVPVVVVLTPLTTDEFPEGQQQRTKLRAYFQQAIAQSGAEHVSLLELAPYEPDDGWGCAWHPSPAANRRMATALTERLRLLLGW